MTGNLTAFLYNDDFMKYYFGPSHPFQPGRVKQTKELLERSGVFQGAAFLQPTKDATVNDLRLVHTQRHIDFVHSSSMRGFGLLDQGDTPAALGIYEGSLAVVGATLEGVEGIMQGRFNHAFNPAGGLHHARADRSAGFCVFNDVAIAMRALQRRHGIQRVAMIDIDGHHGDGTQSVFSNEKTLTISMHHYGSGFYPGSGSELEDGDGEGKGYSINIPLPFRTGDQSYLSAYREIVIPALEAYRPEVIVHQFGVDGHFSDPLVGLGLTTHAYEEVARLTHEAAHRLCGGRYLVLGGGGYNEEAVKRCWAIMFCTISGQYPIDPEAYQAMHDKTSIPEPQGAREEVMETVEKLKKEVLPFIR
jgi:acetoin utilization protein AcuC